MKKSAVKWVLIATFMVVLSVVVPSRATTISDYQRQQQELRKEQERVKKEQEEEQRRLDALSGDISDLEGDAEEIAAFIDELDESVFMIMASVDMIVEEIAEKEENIAITTILYEEAKKNEETQYEGMKLRIKHMYETADISIIQVLVEANSFSEMLNRLEYMEKLNEYDSLQLDNFVIAKLETEAIKDQLEDEKAALYAQRHELEEEKEELERILKEKQELYEDFEILIAKARQQAAVYSANIKNKSAQIKELAKKEAEVKAQELAAIKALEEARKKAAGNTSSAGGNYLPPSSFSGSTGERIAAYACQFIGNPYVAGGTSLTSGADCSGFIWRVYRDFGYTVPRNSFSFRTAGTGVEYSDAKPGDIICYAGHVGIYIGNGKIVHASTERTGIIITNAAYKTILAVRRLV